jgi:glycosyltransferase involved in cell wall biosynthesis
VPWGPLLDLSRVPLPPPVVVHVHGLGALVPWSPFVGRRPRGPVVGTLHGVLDRRLSVGVRGPKRLWHERVDVPLLRLLDGVHVTRPSEVESARPLLVGRPEPACLPWFLADRAPPAAPAAGARGAREPFALFVGRLHPIKGIERLFEAFALVPGRPRLLLAGSGPPGYVRCLSRRARDLGIRPRVEFLGHVGPEPLAALRREASVAVLPSLYENFGMVVLEALREGCPVVASREAPWDALEASGAGRHVDFARPPEARDAIAPWFDPAARAEASPRARALFEAFTPPRVVPRFAAWYQDVVRRTATGTAP